MAGTRKVGRFDNVVIAQSGGPTMVINASLAGAVRAACGSDRFGRILGARHGIAGILAGDYTDLRRIATKERLAAIASTPSSALGSCRLKPGEDECRRIFAEFKRRRVGWFFYIGGNDSADAARIVAEEAEKDGYPLVCYHIPKTIDNDLRNCDHTPGFGSAARFVACAFKGDDLDNRALGGVKINVVMGRDAGFLTAASALARENPGDGPHLIYLPERPFSLDRFVADVREVMKRRGRCVVAVSEGIRDAKGTLFAAKFAAGERDSHGNLQLSGTGALGDYLARHLKAEAGIARVRADTFGYLQRSFPGIASAVDAKEAAAAGAAAVKAALAGRISKGTIAVVRLPGSRYRVRFEAQPIENAAKFTRSMPDRFIAPSGNDVTRAFVEYARPIVGPLPHCELL